MSYASGQRRMALPWPRPWGNFVAKAKLVLVGAAVLSAFFCYTGVQALTARRSAEAAFSFLLVLVTLLAGACGFVTRISCRRRRRRVRLARLDASLGSAVLVSHSRTANVLYVSFMLSVGLLFIATPLLADLIPRTGTWWEARFHTWAFFAPVLAVYPVALVMTVLVRGRRKLGVGLSPDGIYRWSWFSCSFFSWNWIQGIHLREGRELVVHIIVQSPTQRPSNPEEDWAGRLNLFRRSNSRILAGYLAVDPATAYYMLHHYLQHPERRHELAHQAGADRISTGDLE
jgi:uncharacterized membrane protein YwaF